LLPPCLLGDARADSHSPKRGAAARGETDKLGAGVARIGDAPHVAVPLQRSHDLGDCLPSDANVEGKAGGVPPAAKQRDQQHSMHRAQFWHARGGEVGAQPVRALSRKKLDKCWHCTHVAVGRVLAHDLILPYLTLTSHLPKFTTCGLYGAAWHGTEGWPWP